MTSVREQMAQLYGVPVAYISLAAVPGSVVLMVMITLPPDAVLPEPGTAPPLNHSANASAGSSTPDQVEPPAPVSAAALLQERVASTGDAELSIALDVPAHRSSNVTVQASNVTVERTETVERELVCEPGFWCATGTALPCSAGYAARNSSTASRNAG